MKRYWRLIIVTAVALITIGAFYIQSALSASSYPELVIETISGNEDVLEPVIIDGSYSNGEPRSESFQITSDGSAYKSEQSFLERIQYTRDRDIRQLKDNYRRFMRGKGGNRDSYADSENKLTYADVTYDFENGYPSDMTFDVAVMDKESDDSTTFSVPVPNRAMYSHVSVEDVQQTEEGLSVFTRHFSNDGHEEMHHFQFDIAKQTISGDDKLVESDSTRTRLRIVTNADEKTGDNTIMLMKTEQPSRAPSNGQAGTVPSEAAANQGESTYFIYDMDTGEKTSLELPDALTGHSIIGRDADTLFVRVKQEVVVYNMDRNEIEARIGLSSSESNKSDNITGGQFIQISDGHMYVLTRSNPDQVKASQLTVYNSETGDRLYRGEIKPESSISSNDSWQFRELRLK